MKRFLFTTFEQFITLPSGASGWTYPADTSFGSYTHMHTDCWVYLKELGPGGFRLTAEVVDGKRTLVGPTFVRAHSPSVPPRIVRVPEAAIQQLAKKLTWDLATLTIISVPPPAVPGHIAA